MKYERSILVILGAVIGFTAAFIIFEFATEDKEVRQNDTAAGKPGGFVANLKSFSAESQSDTVDSIQISDVIIDTIGLHVMREDTLRPVSAARIPPNGESIGYHYAITTYNVNSDGTFLHICSQPDPAMNVCEHVIYDARADVLRPVKIQGSDERVSSTIRDLNAYFDESDVLVINSRTSLSSATPWILE